MRSNGVPAKSGKNLTKDKLREQQIAVLFIVFIHTANINFWQSDIQSSSKSRDF